MDTVLDLHDIQGNIMWFYPEFGFLKARNIFLKINNSAQGREIITRLMPEVTSSAHGDPNNTTPWPASTTNVSFTYNGLKQLGLSVQSLQTFPDEFIMGMKGRRTILGDDNESAPEEWDPIWNNNVHINIALGAPDDAAMEKRYTEFVALVDEFDGIDIMTGHRNATSDNMPYQDSSVLFENGLPSPKEHFGYADGISNPFFKGMTADMGEVIGGGKKSNEKGVGYGDPSKSATWQPLEAGEFILGHKDEAKEYPAAATPPLLSKNGSFMVYRKLHENVGMFNNFLEEKAKTYGGEKEKLAAKMAGRWRNGVPITTHPNEADADKLAQQRAEAQYATAVAKTPADKAKAVEAFRAVNRKFTGFDYDKDLSGGKCPVGAHARRMNPRGSLEFGKKEAFNTPSALADRRRIIRRGLPYGIAKNEQSNDGDHGIVFMAIVANIKRQFEFVQQQWINYGNDFKLGNDKDPLIGNHHAHGDLSDNRMIIEGDKATGKPPHFLSQIPRFVTTRGGDYFFIPSITSLRMIGEGIIDPT